MCSLQICHSNPVTFQVHVQLFILFLNMNAGISALYVGIVCVWWRALAVPNILFRSKAASARCSEYSIVIEINLKQNAKITHHIEEEWI